MEGFMFLDVLAIFGCAIFISIILLTLKEVLSELLVVVIPLIFMVFLVWAVIHVQGMLL